MANKTKIYLINYEYYCNLYVKNRVLNELKQFKKNEYNN